ncbi:MAG: CPBP family intramembrane metalloprotease [Candidatus Thorarchaeota archaeon]|nr:CPBP family intramembrane metalloprotease [Candidatus Thorarchaeota archaeon]
MTVAQLEKTDFDQEGLRPTFSRMSLLHLGLMFLAIGVVWRIADVFIFNLGNTWINIMPSKLGPLLILAAVFYRYRRDQLASTLGICSHKMRVHIVVGLMVFLVMYLIVDIGASVLYGSLLDPSYPLDFHVISAELLWYSFIFFFVNAVFEETLFRGLLQNGLRTRLSINTAIVASAVVFGTWHIIWPIANNASIGEAFGMLFISAFLGLLFGVYYEKFSSRKTLTGPIIAHTLVNFANESFKIGPDPAVQGPDFVFMEPGLMMISLFLLLVVFTSITYLLWRFRIEDVEHSWEAVKQRFYRRQVD